MQLKLSNAPNQQYDWLKWLIVSAMAVCIVLLLNACNTPEKLAQKAMINPTAFNIVGTRWDELHPCVNDTVFKTKSDTVTNYGYDTITLAGEHNDYYHTDTVKIRITKTLFIRDTLIQTVNDNRGKKDALDTAEHYKILFLQEAGKTLAAKIKADDYKHKYHKLIMWLIIALVILILWHYRHSIITAFTGIPSISRLKI
jgi:6-pyruvoyl-tetrahydropterin synthase